MSLPTFVSVLWKAGRQWQKTVSFKEEYWPAHWNLANTYYYHRGQIEEAVLLGLAEVLGGEQLLRADDARALARRTLDQRGLS